MKAQLIKTSKRLSRVYTRPMVFDMHKPLPRRILVKSVNPPVSYTLKLQAAVMLFLMIWISFGFDLTIAMFKDSAPSTANSFSAGVWIDSPATDQYSPIADSYIDEASAGSNFGTSASLFVKARSTNKNMRTYASFDFHFPNGTTINNSTLGLYMNGPNPEDRVYEVRKALGSWTETGINWTNQPTVNASATASTNTGSNAMKWLTWDVTPDVQSFASGGNNFGWQVRDSVENSTTSNSRFAGFVSRDDATAVNQPLRPYLQVNFTPPIATTNHLVVNEVYPFVGTGKGTDTNNEWVEIYNPTDSSIDISGWQICDNGACDTIPVATPVIPSHGFAIIANASNTWSSFWPGTPVTAVKIGLGSAVGDGLANAGDRVILKDATIAHNIIDTMSYGTDVTYMTLPAPKIGISLARIVKGYDNDVANDWVLNNTPNPGTNPSVDGTEVMRFTDDGIEVAATEAELPPIETQPEIIAEPIIEPTLVDLTLIEPEIFDPILNSGEIASPPAVVEEPIVTDENDSVPAEEPAPVPDVLAEEPIVAPDAPVDETTPLIPAPTSETVEAPIDNVEVDVPPVSDEPTVIDPPLDDIIEPDPPLTIETPTEEVISDDDTPVEQTEPVDAPIIEDPTNTNSDE